MATEVVEVVRNKKKGTRRKGSLPKLVCFHPVVDGPRFDRGVPEIEYGEETGPTHLVVMVNGIIGRAGDLRFAAKKLVKRFPNDIIVHRSRCNSNIKTFHGVDVMGTRLANEVQSVIKDHTEFTKISFVAHSLGGLVARYAVAKLYHKNQSTETATSKEEGGTGRIAGLEAMNFVTFATPHLGSKWHRQVPLLCGSLYLEKVLSRSSRLLGNTGKHLCLTDKDENGKPLLCRMVKDSEDIKFISSLRAFKRRVVYSNAHFDLIVGWKSSSIRRQNEIPERKDFKPISDKYPHIVNLDISEGVPISEESNDMEEAMIQGLSTLSWERVDVSFLRSIQRFNAHNTILVMAEAHVRTKNTPCWGQTWAYTTKEREVKTRYLSWHGSDVIKHMIDHLMK